MDRAVRSVGSRRRSLLCSIPPSNCSWNHAAAMGTICPKGADTGRHLACQPGYVLGLLDGDLPFALLLLNGRATTLRTRCRIEHLTDTACRLWNLSSIRVRITGCLLFSSVSTATLLASISNLVRGRLTFLCFEAVIDFLRAHPTEAVIHQRFFRQSQTCVEQHGIDSVVACHVPAPWIPAATADVMLESGVHDFVREGPDQLSTAQLLDKLRVEVERHSISCHGCDRATCPRAKAKQQGAEKGMIQQQRRACFLNARDTRECRVHREAASM
jgi:hypothetical protein